MTPHKAKQNQALILLLILLIPALIMSGIIFPLDHGLIIALVTLLTLLLATCLLWNRANKNADGSEWWQDDDASGWRGYF